MKIRFFQHLLAASACFAACFTARSASAAPETVLKPWPAAKPTPALMLTGLNGKEWNLAQLRGKVVVVNFWASWCGPCVEELPVLNGLARQDPDKVVVVGVNYKEPLDSIERFAKEHPFAYPLLRDRTGDAFKQWTAGVMPTTILVDRQGRARWRSAGEIPACDSRLKAAIDALVAE